MKIRKIISGIIVMCVALACLIGIVRMRVQQAQVSVPTTGDTAAAVTTPQSSMSSSVPVTQPQTSLPVTEPVTEPIPTTEPTEPGIFKMSTATVGVTGDILLHDLVIRGGYDEATDTFDYQYMFRHFQDYTAAVDYAVANLEVTLIQKPNSEGLKGYNGYPRFNAPDEIVDALKSAGFDMLLTANNHSYDSKHDGLLRTVEVVAEKGLASIGTHRTTEENRYQIVDINGIRIGMINYTYNTDVADDGSVYLNGIHLTVEDSKLVNSFSYAALDAFYAQLQTQLEAMRADGAEAIVLYIHWGEEYVTKPNSTQKKMAQALCNLGIDVIVGNHSHVPQPVALLTNENDESQKTLCLYSTGNALSNIRRSNTRPVNTEDGMLFTFTFAKYSDGTVVVEHTDVLPTWVRRYDDENDVTRYLILTLDDAIEDWKQHLDISDSILEECRDSYDRTMGIVGAGLEEANAWFLENQTQVEAALGVIE